MPGAVVRTGVGGGIGATCCLFQGRTACGRWNSLPGWGAKKERRASCGHVSKEFLGGCLYVAIDLLAPSVHLAGTLVALASIQAAFRKPAKCPLYKSNTRETHKQPGRKNVGKLNYKMQLK